MIDTTTLKGIEENSKYSLLTAKALIEMNNLNQPEIVQLWHAVIEGTLKGNRDAFMLGLELADVSQDPEVEKLYNDLAFLAGSPSHSDACRPVISSGAAVVRVKAGLVESKGFDGEKFLELAKRCLLNAVKDGTDETRLFAVEALRNFSGEQHEIKKELIKLASISNDTKLMEAVMESLEQIRPYEEAEIARSDLQMIMEANADDTGPVKLYTEMVFGAVEDIYTLMGQPLLNDDLKVAVMQLNNCGIGSKENTDGLMLDDITVQLIRKNVENALVYALRSSDEGIRADAVEALTELGGSRVEAILQKVSEREARDDGMTTTGKAAREVLVRIHRKEKPELPPPLPPAALREKQKAQRAAVR
jgi:hypothetical protein